MRSMGSAAAVAFAAALWLASFTASAADPDPLLAAAEPASRAPSPATRRYLQREAAAIEGWRRQRPGEAPVELVYAPGWPRAGVAATTALAHRPFHREIMKAAERAGIDPVLVHAVIRVESGYNARAVSPRGAVGLMQVIPGTARRYGVDDLLQPSSNISAGTQYLSHLMRIFEGDVRLALAAYNAGENAVLRYGRRIPPYRETASYVPRVLSTYRAMSALPAGDAEGR
jgi:soluble lytic murein transglycosylase-like protein